MFCFVFLLCFLNVLCGSCELLISRVRTFCSVLNFPHTQQHWSLSLQIRFRSVRNVWHQYRLSKVFCFCFVFYPVSLECWNPTIVHSLPGAANFLTRASWLFSLTQPHLCLKSAGGGDVPAQPHAALPPLMLYHWYWNVFLHSFQSAWFKNIYIKKRRTQRINLKIFLQLSRTLAQNLGINILPFWFLKGQKLFRTVFLDHQTCTINLSVWFKIFTKNPK